MGRGLEPPGANPKNLSRCAPMGSGEVSVLLPARNAAPTVASAVRSVLAQTRPALEIIVVDDRSTDGTAAILRGLASEDSRLKVIPGTGSGLVAALNLGLGHCRGDYVARMDADDESLPERLAASVAALEADPSLAAVGTQVEIFREDRPVSPNMQAYARWMNGLTTPERLFADRLVESPLCHPSATLRRAVLEDVGRWREGEFAEDYELWLRLLDKGNRLTNVPRVLFRWRDADRRLTRVDPRYSQAQHLRLKARWLGRGPLREARRCAIWGAGRIGLSLARLLRAQGVEVARFIDVDPGKLGQRIDGARVCPPEELGPPAQAHLVCAVGAKGARENIRRFLDGRGWIEGQHYTCAA